MINPLIRLIEELEIENSRLNQELLSLQEEVSFFKEPNIKHLHLENGELNIGLAGPLIETFALLLGEYFIKTGAENYIEMVLHGVDRDFIVTIQKKTGKTPHELMLEWKEKCEEKSSNFDWFKEQ